MGSFVFKWEHPADEVYVTGTFDEWSKSERLVKKDNVFSKKVFLPIVSKKIYYKFVVDGNWVTDHTAPQENDESGNLNNVLTVDRITTISPDSVGIMSGVTADSSTVRLAGAVPLEKDPKFDSAALPGAFPVSPDVVDRGESEYLINPAGHIGLSNTETVTDEKKPLPVEDSSKTTQAITDEKINDEQVFSVSPLPAFPGAVNPISIAPGEKLPDYSSLTSNDLTTFVDLKDESSRQNTDLKSSIPSTDSVSGSQYENDINKKFSSNLSETSKITDPVSILPVKSEVSEEFSTSPFIQSTGPGSTTAALAARALINSSSKQPLENTTPIVSNPSPDSKAVELEDERSDEIPVPNKSLSSDQVITENGSTTVPVSTSTEGKHPETFTESCSLSKNEPEKLIPNTTSGGVKDAIIESEKNSKESTNQEEVSPNDKIEEDHSPEKKPGNSSEGSIPNPVPQILVEPVQKKTIQPCTITTAETTITNKNTTSDTVPKNECACNSSTSGQTHNVNEEPTNPEKTEKKKKRLSLSFFSKLKAKLTSKDKD